MTSESSPQIAIIGAGISGLAAAKILYQNDFKNIRIFDATARIGGRINTVQFGNGYIEMGAQWIHGQEDNVLFEYAHENNLVADPLEDYGIEGTGSFCCEDGTLANSGLVEELITTLDEAKNIDVDEVVPNMYDYFKEEFDCFIASKPNLSAENMNLLKSVFRWFIIFEVIDNSCDDLCDISSLSYTEWEECDGVVDLINFKHGYSSVLGQLCKEVPLTSMLRLKTAVTKIEPVLCERNHVKVKLHTTKLPHDVEDHEESLPMTGEREELVFDHVIVTSSLGFLKAQLKTNFFDFTLPTQKVDIIRALGYGTINKIFLYFEQSFWFQDEKGFQVLWQNVNDKHSYSYIDEASSEEKLANCQLPNWVHCIQSFDLVRGQPNMLMAWIGSYGAKEMEGYSNGQIGHICGQVLRLIVPMSRRESPIADPVKVFASRWYSHPFMCGSYSNRTVEYQNLKFGSTEYNIDILARPIRVKDAITVTEDQTLANEDCPLVLFAGEATDRSHYSTTDGAFRSGTREAKRLLDYYSQS